METSEDVIVSIEEAPKRRGRPRKADVIARAENRSAGNGELTGENDPMLHQVGGDHYKSMAIQPFEFIQKNRLDFATGNALKYLCRHHLKGGSTDLLKARHYIDLLLREEYGVSA